MAREAMLSHCLLFAVRDLMFFLLGTPRSRKDADTRALLWAA
jgi:hypothetical protein